MAFHEIRFPASVSFGSVGGPERRTEIVTLANGFEERNTPWAEARRRYEAGLGVRSSDDLADVISFFEARKGRLHGFRWKDWSDWKSCAPSSEIGAEDQLIGTGDGNLVEFQLIKTYASGEQSSKRTISKPVSGTVRVAVNGAELVEGADWSVDPASGVVVFSAAPSADSLVTAGYAFDVPARFDTDRLEISVAAFEAGEIPDIPVVELRV